LLKRSFKKYFGSLLTCSILVFIAGCAQIVPLTGGDRDTTPPTIKNSYPKNYSSNFNGKSIIVEFDEYVQLRDVYNQLIVTPALKNQPEISAKGKTIGVDFKEELSPNTTYYFNFGSAIVDLHEANAATNFSLVFSTGDHLDSLRVEGKLTDAFTLQAVGGATVMLFNDLSDSAVYKGKPDYYTKSRSDGTFVLPYVKAGTYKAFALKDNNKNFIYDANELVGFDKTGTIDVNGSDTLNLQMFAEKAQKPFIRKISTIGYGRTELIFSAPIERNADLTLLKKGEPVDARLYKSYLHRNGDTLSLLYQNLFADTLEIIVNHGTLLDTAKLIVQTKEETERQQKRGRLRMELLPDVGTVPISWYYAPGFRSSRLPVNLNKEKVLLVEETDTLKGGRTLTDLDIDSITILNKLNPGKNYQVIFYPGAVSDAMGITNDTSVFKFSTQPADYYSTLTVNLQTQIEKEWILHLYNSKGKLARKISVLDLNDQRTIKLDRLDPDTYSMKLIDDEDRDGQFTPGNYSKKTMPERVIIYNQPIKLTSDWEMEVEWKVE
jgi:hypothetical protein